MANLHVLASQLHCDEVFAELAGFERRLVPMATRRALDAALGIVDDVETDLAVGVAADEVARDLVLAV